MAKGKKTSLAVRALALSFALALVALAAKLWLGSAPQKEVTDASAATEPADEADDAASSAPPLHDEIAPEDRAALRGILRDSQAEAE